MARYTFVVLTNPTAGKEDEFNRWYDEVHVPEVLMVPGFTGASRLRLVPGEDPQPAHRYLALYEIDSDDPQAVLTELQRRVTAGEIAMTDALDMNVSANLFALTGNWTA
jgi:hypothetical protein